MWLKAQVKPLCDQRRSLAKTPPVVNILAGITRRTTIDILERSGFRVDEQPFGRDALYVADEVFMTGTAAEITPVSQVDRLPVGKGQPGPITKLVQEVYSKGVRGEIDWLRVTSHQSNPFLGMGLAT